MVRASVVFSGGLSNNDGLQERVTKLAVFGETADAVDLAVAGAALSVDAAAGLVECIGIAADKVHYATGLRP
jgi:hypothetical protein